MKKFFLSSMLLAFSLTTFAQLPYETELDEDLFNDPSVVISKSDECTWDWSTVSSTCLGLAANVTAKTNSFVVALPSVGLPEKIDFKYSTPFFVLWGEGTITVSESTDHEKWTGVWSKDVNSVKYGQEGSANLSSNTRYLKFEYTGQKAVYIYGIKVKELKELSVNIDEYQFPTAMVDDQPSAKTVTVDWTNVVVNVTSSNPVFTVSTTKIGEKNKENKSTSLVISYNHELYGTHTGEITLEGEGLKTTIAVSGTTKRYDQTLTWNQNLGEHLTTDNVHLNAYTDQALHVTYTSSDSSIAWVDSLGNVKVECAGEVWFTAQQLGNYKYAPTTTISKQIKFNKANPTVAVVAEDITYGQSLREVVLTKVSVVSGEVAFVNINLDTVLDAGVYDLTVRFTPDKECIYNSVDRQVPLVINKANQSIEWNQLQTTLEVDETIDLNAYASSGLELTYAFTNCNIEIDGNQMTGIEEGNVLVIAFQEGNNNYYPSTVAMQEFEVNGGYIPTAARQVEANPSLDELEKNGKKYYHNSVTYIYYRGHTYTAKGQRIN